MKLIKTGLLLLFVLVFHLTENAQDSTRNKTAKEKAAKETVYVCDSNGATVFHSSNSCRGIKNCKHEILKVSKTEAINEYGRRACKICY